MDWDVAVGEGEGAADVDLEDVDSAAEGQEDYVAQLSVDVEAPIRAVLLTCVPVLDRTAARLVAAALTEAVVVEDQLDVAAEAAEELEVNATYAAHLGYVDVVQEVVSPNATVVAAVEASASVPESTGQDTREELPVWDVVVADAYCNIYGSQE